MAVDLDPLSLLSRLAASVPAKGTHTVRYAGVLASASKLRSRVVPVTVPPAVARCDGEESKPKKTVCRYRTWAELLAARAQALTLSSSDLRLNPHLHVVFLDGVYEEEGKQVVFHALPNRSAFP